MFEYFYAYLCMYVQYTHVHYMQVSETLIVCIHVQDP